VRRFPSPEHLSALLERAGFEQVSYRLLGGGSVVLHTGTAPEARGSAPSGVEGEGR
jgi:ubiquinone/menaquinone biosynthesis C-methylase UbiE